jgi:hypothetical protein
MRRLFAIIAVLTCGLVQAQSTQPFRVAEGTTTVIGPNPNSFYKGFLLPQSANAARPANKAGVILWNTDGTVAQINDGSGWLVLQTGVIGTNIQAYDPDLTTYAGITPSSNVQTLLGSANYAAFRTSLSLVPGTDVQVYDADLDDLADGSLSGSKVGTGIDAGNISAGTLAVARGGTGQANLTNLITLETHTVGNFLATIADNGNGTMSVAGGSGAENAAVQIGVSADSINGTQLADTITVDGALVVTAHADQAVGLSFTYAGTGSLLKLTSSGAAASPFIIDQTNAGDADPTVQFDLGGTAQFTIGVDESTATDDLVFADGATLGTNNRLTINGSTGVVSVGTGLTVTSGFVILPTATELTIASGAVTATQSVHTLDTEADAAADDLDTINGGVEGATLTLLAVSNLRDVTLKDNTGNLNLPGDVVLDHVRDRIELHYSNGFWCARSPVANNN